MNINEVVEAQIKLCELQLQGYDSGYFSKKLEQLTTQLKESISIDDLKANEYNRGFFECYHQSNQNFLEKLEEAFNAGRDDTRSYVHDDDLEYTYETFQDYLESKQIK